MSGNKELTADEKLAELLKQIEELHLSSSVIASAEAKISDFKKNARQTEFNEMKTKVEALADSCGYDVTFHDRNEKPLHTVAYTEEVVKIKTPVPPKFVSPVDGKTWCGRGLTPLWFNKLLEEGHTKDSLLIVNATLVPESEDKVIERTLNKGPEEHQENQEN